MELAFETKQLRTVCESEGQAVRELGIAVAERLKHRLADLRAAKSPKDLVAGRPRLLGGTDHRQMVVDLCEGKQLVFCANHAKNPTTESGDIDWPKVGRIKILRID